MKRTAAFSPYFKKLPKEFYDQDCFKLCESLLGKVLVRKLPNGEVVRGTIVETEAYPGDNDKASNSFGGRRTPANEALYMDPGTCYVYLTYGMYHCFNISSQGDGAGCLLRGVHPIENSYEPLLKQRCIKRTKTKSAAASKKKDLKIYEVANGPSKLCLAFDINKECNKVDLVTSDLMWLEENEGLDFHEGNFTIERATRVGIDNAPAEARNQLYRYFISDNFAVSTMKPAQIKKKLQQQEEQEQEGQEVQ